MAQSGRGMAYANVRSAFEGRHPEALGDGSRGRGNSGRNRGAEPRDRVGVSAASGRGRHLGARHAGAVHRADRGRCAGEPRSNLLCSFPEVPQCTSQTGRPDDGTDTTGFFNTEFFVDLKPKEQWRPGFHQNKGRADRGDEQGVGEDPRRDLEFLSADCRQHGGSRQRSERRTGGQAVRDRPANAGKHRAGDHQRDAHDSRRRGSGPVPRDRAAELESHLEPRQGRALPDQR
jgi:hypothetical protein